MVSLLSGEIPRCADDEDVDGLLSLSEKSVLLDIASRPSEASRLLGENPRDEVDEMAALLSFSAKSMFFTTALTESEASRLLGEFPLSEADEEAGLLSFSGKSMFLDKAPLPIDVDVLLGESPRVDFAVVCDVALDILDTDTLGEIPGDDAAEERVPIFFSVRSILLDRALIPPDVAVIIAETRDGIATAAGLVPLLILMLFDSSAAPFEAVGVLGDETDKETRRSILSARSILLVNAFVADAIVAFFGETPRDGIDDSAGLEILSVRSTLLDIALTDTLPPIIAGQRWWSITLACGFSGCCSAALLPLDGLLFLSPASLALA